MPTAGIDVERTGEGTLTTGVKVPVGVVDA